MRLSYIVVHRVESFPSDGEFRRALSVIREAGYEGVELSMTAPLLKKVDVLQDWLKEHDLVLPSFLTGEAYLDGLCLTSKDASIRRDAVQHLTNCVDAAAQLGSIFVVGLMQGTARDEADLATAQHRIVESLSIVAAAAQSKSVRFVIEPVNHLQVGFHNSVAEVLDLIDRIGSPAVLPMVDTIHMNIEESSMSQAIRSCGAHLGHVHLCESNGGRFGTGHTDFEEVLGALKEIDYRGFGSVKVYRGLGLAEGAQSSLNYLRKLAASEYISPARKG